MTSIAEYTYESGQHHLSDKEALEAYRKAKALHGDAIVDLEDLDCGHWNIHTYITPDQKQAYYRRRLDTLYRILLNRFRNERAR